ncbi:MAG: LD-carboxypeptidase [Bdellovibrionales bacterium]|nr:LD-carboxypeptidase [Bdellovibrionales bacterium]
MRVFESLKAGDVIGVIALSAACEPGRFDRGIRALESYGFRTKVVLDPAEYYGSKAFLFSSAAAIDRAEGLSDLYRDSEVRAILAARGAYGCMEILPHLDFKELSKHPKPLIGFSDVTALLLALYHRTELPLIHGPTLESTFSKSSLDPEYQKSAESLVGLLRGDGAHDRATPLRLISGNGNESLGPLIGGNLTLVTSLLGSEWDPSFDGHILFLEEIGEQPYRVHRELLKLKLAGKLSGLRGVLLGQFTACEHAKKLGPTCEEAIQDIFKDCNYPVYGFGEFGHVAANLPLCLGQIARLSPRGVEYPE